MIYICLLFFFFFFLFDYMTSKCLNYCLRASGFFVCLLLLLLLFIFYQVVQGGTSGRKGLLHYYGKKIKTFASVTFSIYSVFNLYFYSRLLCFARKTTMLVKTGGNHEAILPLKATCISTFKINYSKTEEKLMEYWQLFFCINHNPQKTELVSLAHSFCSHIFSKVQISLLSKQLHGWS